MKNKNYAQWNVLHYMWDSVVDFESRWNRIPGVHTIYFGADEPPIDIYVNEHVQIENHDVQPILFTAAVAQRGSSQGPFFSGLGIAKSKELPLIAIADPSLDNDPSLNLAWYTGGPNDNVEGNLLKLFEALHRSLHRELLFVGGSGGGYAALSFARRFVFKSSVVVWNPQTDIYEYNERFVKSYLRSQFNFAYSALARDDWKAFCKYRTDQKIATNILDTKTIDNPRRVIYLQNATDWHLTKHLQPLWATISHNKLVDGKNILDSNHIIVVDKFAEGHASPPSSLIASILSQLMNLTTKIEDLNFSKT